MHDQILDKTINKVMKMDDVRMNDNLQGGCTYEINLLIITFEFHSLHT